ncbi:hypothetical protein MASR2M44_07780 [Bacteroidota bacterium]
MKFTSILSIFAVVSLFASCSNDLEINAPYKDIPVVHAFLDQNEPVQYIRIQKVYQNGTGSTTLEGAQITDSLYFDSLIVDLIEARTGTVYPCKRIDTVYKDSGLFSNAVHHLYVTSFPKNENAEEQFNLRIHVPRSGNTFYNKEPINLVKDAFVEDRTISVDTVFNHSFPYRFRTGRNATLYDLSIRFYYTETEKANPSNVQEKVFEYFIQRAKVYTYSASIKAEAVLSKNFISNLQANIKFNNLVNRKYSRIEFVAYGGSKEYQEYLELSKPNTSIVPKNSEYSNITGGKGIFSSRNKIVQTQMKLDSKSIGILTAILPNFVN